MKKYHYFIAYMENELTIINYGNVEVSIDRKITELDDLNEIADLIKESKKFKNRPIIINFKLLKKEC